MISNYQIASLVPYDNSVSGLTASDVQAAIDELFTDGEFLIKGGQTVSAGLSFGTLNAYSLTALVNNTVGWYISSDIVVCLRTEDPVINWDVSQTFDVWNYARASSTEGFNDVITTLAAHLYHDGVCSANEVNAFTAAITPTDLNTNAITKAVVSKNYYSSTENRSVAVQTVKVLEAFAVSKSTHNAVVGLESYITPTSVDDGVYYTATGVDVLAAHNVPSGSVISSDANAHVAYGVRVRSVRAGKSSVSNTAYGIYIDSGALVAADTSPNKYALYIDDSSDNFVRGVTKFRAGIKLSLSSPGDDTLDHYEYYTEGDLGTLTWTGTTAPSGTISKKYKAIRIGDQVTFWFRVEASIAGTAITGMSVPLPLITGISTPAAFSTTANGEYDVVGSGAMSSAPGSAPPTGSGTNTCFLGKTAGGVWTFYVYSPSVSVRAVWGTVQYLV